MSTARAKGTRWETRLVRYLRDSGWPLAERRALAGKEDRGDITNAGPIAWEAKNQRQINLAAWVDEAEVERKNAGARFGVVCFPRRNKSVERAYVVIELAEFVELLHAAGF